MTGLDSVRHRIVAATARVNRSPNDVTLVIVSKGQSVDAVKALYDRGERDFGENRAQELAAKAGQLPRDIRWHFVGPLQSNKARMVRPIVSLLHSLDRLELGPAWIKGPGLAPPALLQVNIGREPQKHGFDPARAVDAFADLAGKGINLVGLMAIPPLAIDPEATRPFFVEMRRLAALVEREHPGGAALSMGMTDDFEVAIEEGATFLRVGRAIFGGK